MWDKGTKWMASLKRKDLLLNVHFAKENFFFLNSSNSKEMSCLLTNWICAIQAH